MLKPPDRGWSDAAPVACSTTTRLPLADPALTGIMEALVPLHHRLCPRQVLGARIGLEGGRLLDLALPRARGDKRLLAFVETDGCFTDGVAATTGCSVGHRTMRIVDQGKMAVTFVDTMTELAVRVWPRSSARIAALACAGGELDRWHAQRDGYLRMPAAQLLESRRVQLAVSLDALLSRPGVRVTCAECGEEVSNGREILVGHTPLCRACAGETYLRPNEDVGAQRGGTAWHASNRAVATELPVAVLRLR